MSNIHLIVKDEIINWKLLQFKVDGVMEKRVHPLVYNVTYILVHSAIKNID